MVIKYNKPDIFIVDKLRKEITIVEVGIAGCENLYAVVTEKKHKYDLLANHTPSLYKYKSKIMPYVMTRGCIIINYLRLYANDPGLER